MPAPLRLTLTDYLDATRWRWVLKDSRDRFLADHDVRLDPTTREYGGFLDLSTYLDYHQPIYPPARQLDDLGAWIGEKVFGGLREALWARQASPAVAVQVVVPQAAEALLFRPFELARFANGTSFRKAGVRFVYGIEEAPHEEVAKEPTEGALRILAAFSLPVRSNPLNLRRERFGLQRLVRELNQTQNLAVELRVLQYGATRDTLREALEEAEGWDIIHFSCHGQQGELLLEDDRGGSDTIDANELGELLDHVKARLKLLILDACYSGVGRHAVAREQVGLERAPERQEEAEAAAPTVTTPTALPSLAQALSRRLDCAALAMRYPVGDDFATELMLALYDKLLERRRPLPAALHLALDDALAADIPKPPLSSATPILVGVRAAELQLVPPPREAQTFNLPTVGLSIAFPREPERFVGRLQPMLRASQALARRSPKRGVLFYGMPGAGKTACALELAYRHEQGRFTGYVWHRAPEADSDISSALFNLMQDIQTQLNAPGLGLTTALDDPRHFRQYTLPRLRALLKQHSLLLVLDNLETLLTDSDGWRDPLWGEVVAALLAHDGPSRVVLTSRRVPADLAKHKKVQAEPIHALSLAESVLLARELPNLRRLFDDEAGRALLRQTLRVVQGLPELLRLADGLAADRATLTARVAAAADEVADRADVLDAFFTVGGTHEGETRQEDADFVRALQGWTAGVAGVLSPTARLLFAFLCRVEPEDRRQDILEANWKDFLTRLGPDHAVAVAALAEPEQGQPAALTGLEAVGLVDVERSAIDPAQIEELKALLAAHADQGSDLDPAALPGLLTALAAQATPYTIHPGVAETERAAADPAVLAAADVELGDYHIAMVYHGQKREMEGGGSGVAESARCAAPYLLRQERWGEASTMLEQMLVRDNSPDSLAFALPLLRRIVEATANTKEELENAGILAKTLWKTGRTDEAESLQRDLIARSVARGNYRLASTAAGDLLNLLWSSGRLGEALQVAEELAGYTAQAGLGPWTLLSDEVQRLQVMAGMGRYDEVLTAVEMLRPKMDVLPLKSEAGEAVNPWNVRETLLDTGHTAALYSERWETALTLNAEVVKAKESRGAGALEVARTRFNDYAPLLRLRHYADARALLHSSRAVFQAEHDIESLSRVYSALADLEENTGGRVAAVRFEEVALGYSYQADEPDACAISHHNLANYLQRQGADPATVLAHRLSSATIRLQMRSGRLPTTVRNLALSDLSPTPPAFTDVAERVETIEGVRFRALFERLPRTVPDGNAALAAVWQMVADEKGRRDETKQRRDAVLASAPAAVRAAFEREGDEFAAALRAAIAELPEAEAAALLQRLQEAGLIQSAAGPDMTQVLNKFEPLLQDIAAATGDESQREPIEPVLAELEEKGWRLTDPVHRIWAGERDAEALTVGMDGNSAQLVRRVLELLDQ
jgi:hypothetical protein